MPTLRWLLPLVAALSLLGQAVVTFAAAGLTRVATCCCPDPDSCECHDHDGTPSGSPAVERCGQAGELVTPLVLAAVLPPAEPVVEVVAVAVITSAPIPMPDPRPVEIETPPF